MNRKHPNERELQQFANRSCSELMARRIQEHAETCGICRHKAKVYMEMNRQLNAMTDAQPSPEFADRIMERLADEPSLLVREQGSGDQGGRTPVRRSFWRPELTNLLAAAVATYLFIHAGILQQVITLDAGVLESGLRGKVDFVIGFVDKVTNHIRY